MSWLFSQALVEEFSAVNSLDGEPSALLNLMDTPHKFWHNGKTMDALSHSRYGLTCKVLTEQHGKDLLTWYRADFLAKTLVVPEKAQVSTESAPDYGQKWHESSERYDRNIASLKTVRYLESEDSASSYQTLPRWGSMQSGVLSERTTSEHLIDGKGCGSLLPTPSGCRSGKNHVAGRLDEWGGSSNIWRGTPIGKMHCPPFEEWVMGWPEQWTELTQSATAKFRQWQRQHGEF